MDNNVLDVLSGNKPIRVDVDLSPNAMVKFAVIIIGAVIVSTILTRALR